MIRRVLPGIGEKLYSVISTAVINGIDGVPVSVEADISEGMPLFEMV